MERWPSATPGAIFFLSLSQGKVKVGFWPLVAKWSMGRCFISTKVNPRHSQTTNRSITDHFSINQNHQGPSQRRLTDICKIQDFDDFHSAQGGGRSIGNFGNVNFRIKPPDLWVVGHFQCEYERPVLKDERAKLTPLQAFYHYLREK